MVSGKFCDRSETLPGWTPAQGVASRTGVWDADPWQPPPPPHLCPPGSPETHQSQARATLSLFTSKSGEKIIQNITIYDMNDIVSLGLIKIMFLAIRSNRGISARKSRTSHTITMTLYTEVWTCGPGEVGGSPVHIQASWQCGYK